MLADQAAPRLGAFAQGGSFAQCERFLAVRTDWFTSDLVPGTALGLTAHAGHFGRLALPLYQTHSFHEALSSHRRHAGSGREQCGPTSPSSVSASTMQN